MLRQCRAVHRYGRDPSQVADLHVPRAARAWPVAVVIHGGFWRQRYDRTLMDAVSADLAARGWAAWNLEYRRIGPGGRGGWPADLRRRRGRASTTSPISARAGAPIDLRTVVTIGHSAGGHLALWAATRDRPRVAVTAAVGQAAVSDLARASRLGLSDGAADELWAARPTTCPSATRRGLARSQRLPAGCADAARPRRAATTRCRSTLSRDLHAAAVAAGDACELVVPSATATSSTSIRRRRRGLR